MAEIWNVYDADGNDTGRIIERGARMSADEYHLVVNVWLENSSGAYLISRRSANKSDALKWESTGGSVLAGESALQGALREVKEELGISLRAEDGCFVCRGLRRYDGCPDILEVWKFPCDVPADQIVLQEGETCEAKYASKEEISRMVHAGEWIPMEKYNYLPLLGI